MTKAPFGAFAFTPRGFSVFAAGHGFSLEKAVNRR